MPTMNFAVNEAIVASIRNWLDRTNLRRSMAGMDGHDREQVLAECGLSRSDLDRLARMPLFSEDLLSPLMRTIGLDPEEIGATEPALMRDLQRVCMACHNRRRCRRSVKHGHAAALYRTFCPNAPAFDGIAAQPDVAST